MTRRAIRPVSIAIAIAWWGVSTYAQTIMVDRTGSMADIDVVQASLVDAVSNSSPIVDEFGLCLFSQRPLASPVVTVSITKAAGVSRIDHVNRAREEEARAALRGLLEHHLGSHKSIVAKKTDIAAVLRRADTERKPTLLLTDGADETGRQATVVGDGQGVHVVLCADRRDDSSKELELFDQRKAAILTMLPKATVYGCYQMQQAAQAWARAARAGGVSLASRKME